MKTHAKDVKRIWIICSRHNHGSAQTFVAKKSSIIRLAKHFKIVKFLRNLRSMDITDTLAYQDSVREVCENAPEGWANLYQHGLHRDNAWLWRVKDESGNEWEGTIKAR